MDHPTPLRSPMWKGQELGCLEESVGSEDGGDNLASGIDGALTV
jgi:hypothetical protein